MYFSKTRRAVRGWLPILALVLGAAPAARASDAWLDALTLTFVEHYAPDGQLALEWARARPPEANEPVELSVVSFPASLAPQMLVRVRAVTPSGTGEHILVLQAQLWREGWVLREPSVRGNAVDTRQLDRQRYDALRDREALSSTDELDLIFARNVPAGRTLTWRDVTRRPLVRRGQMIEVAATDGTMTVTLRALALADGGRGEVVRVRNPDSRKEFSAQVIADARAQVQF